MDARDTNLHIEQRIITTKAHENSLPSWLKIFEKRVVKVKNPINNA